MARPHVCFLLEGTYPYVTGGVSTWVHELIKAQPQLRFSIVTILANRDGLQHKYALPANVVEVRNIFLHEPPPGQRGERGAERAVAAMAGPLTRLLKGGALADLATILAAMRRHGAGAAALMNSRAAWHMLSEMYEDSVPSSSFLDYFWTWRMLVGSVLATLAAELPEAGCYHAVSTGYAGLLAAKAHLAMRRPVYLTEHGIYTNERRIEISMAEWLYEDPVRGFNIEASHRDLRDVWQDAFASFSRICYQASDEIITLYRGNQVLQRRDGADPRRMRVVPNGVAYDRYSAIRRTEHNPRPVIALIGRVVQIKDVKTFIRAVHLLRQRVPEVEALVLGPTDEDMAYFEECQAMVRHMDLGDTLRFLGRVNIAEYLGRIDVNVLTSISEAQPLVILEAGAAGVPSVTTDVGACHEMIYGRPDEAPALGTGGAVVPVANPAAVAFALGRLLTDPDHWRQCSQAIRERVGQHYHEKMVNGFYRSLYEAGAAAPDGRAKGDD